MPVKNQPHQSNAEENYLKSIYHLASKNGEVSVNELAKQMQLKMPTVTSMMKKMSEHKLINYEKYKPIRLTEKGKKQAALIIRKHRLTEMFLVEKMHFGWEEVHDIAEQVEHIKSPAFFKKMDEMLGYPTRDPHGSPIPDADGKVHFTETLTLSDCKKGDQVKLTGLLNTTAEFLKFLNNHEIKLGLRMKIIDVEEFDGSIIVQYAKKTNVLSHVVSNQLIVHKP